MIQPKKAHKISDKVYVVPNAIVEFRNDAAYGGGMSGNSNLRGYAFWGDKDAVLYEMHKLCCDNPTKWRLMTTKRDFVIGDGLMGRIKGSKDSLGPQPIESEMFIEKLHLNKLLRDCALQLEFASRFFVKLVLDFNMRVESLQMIDVFHCRPRIMSDDEEQISAYVLNKNFGTKKYRQSDSVVLPAFDSSQPTKYAVSIIDIRNILPGQIYNPFGLWWGTKAWTEVANKIPAFHLSGLDNGYNIKYHVSIPDNYFEGDGLSAEESEELKQDVCGTIHDTLKGKTDSAVFTFHSVDVNGKELSGVRIVELPNKISDDAFTAVFNVANNTSSSAHGVQPILSGIDTGSKLGGSGKEIEAAARYTQGWLTRNERTLLLEFVGYLADIEGINNDIEFYFGDIEIYNFDVTPTKDTANPNS